MNKNILFFFPKHKKSEDLQRMQYLKDIYDNPKHPASFTGPVKLYQFIKSETKFKISLKTIKKWMSAQEPYTLHRSVRRNFKRNRIMVGGIDDQVKQMYNEYTS